MAVEDSNTKRCYKCGETKPKTEFHKCSSKHDGLQPKCKCCGTTIGYAGRVENIEKCRSSEAAYRSKNREKCSAAYAVWAASNPEKARIKDQNRRARVLAVGGKLSHGLADKLFKLQRGKCACGCKQPLGTDYHLDHIMPLALGGSNTDDNIQLLRQRCNNQKHAKHPVDFMQERGFLL